MTEGMFLNEHNFAEFCGHMFAQILKHKNDKLSLEDMEPENVLSVTKIAIMRRLAITETNDVDVIKKECVHMANYLYFTWSKMNEIDKLNR